jgi:TrmH family RNA methyltransferase
MQLNPNDAPRLSDNKAKKLRGLKQKKIRDRDNRFCAEGLRLCKEAYDAGAAIRDVVVTPEALRQAEIATLIQHTIEKKIPLYKSSLRQFKTLSDEKSPQGILFVIEKPTSPALERINSSLVLALDNLQDPGNLGTILRSAEWFGVRDIILSAGCVDPYNPKAVRSSMGAIFRTHLYLHVDLAALLARAKNSGYKIVASAADAETSLGAVNTTNKNILLIGNEAHGLSPALSPFIDVSVRIPGHGHGDSLNAAAATSILLYHFAQHSNDAV